MPVYTILSVDVLPDCAVGQRHVAKASLLIDKSPGGVVTTAKLLDLAAEGARFSAPALDGSSPDLPIALMPCLCEKGHLIRPAGLVDEYPVRG